MDPKPPPPRPPAQASVSGLHPRPPVPPPKAHAVPPPPPKGGSSQSVGKTAPPPPPKASQRASAAQEAVGMPAPSMGASHGSRNYWVALDAGVNAGWIEMRDGNHHYCTLCNKWATEEHLTNQKHVDRLQWWMSSQATETSCCLPAARLEDNSTGIVAQACPIMQPEEPWVEIVEGCHFCTLCARWATPEHLASQKHNDRVVYHKESQAVVQNPIVDAPFLERRSFGGWGDELYCLLCDKWADENHLNSRDHMNRVPDWEMHLSLKNERECVPVTSMSVSRPHQNINVLCSVEKSTRSRSVPARRARVIFCAADGHLVLELEGSKKEIRIPINEFEDWPLGPRLGDMMVLANSSGRTRSTPRVVESAAFSCEEFFEFVERLWQKCQIEGAVEMCSTAFMYYRPFMEHALNPASDLLLDTRIVPFFRFLLAVARAGAPPHSPQRKIMEQCAESTLLRQHALVWLTHAKDIDELADICGELVERILVLLPATVCYLKDLLFATIGCEGESVSRLRRVVDSVSDAISVLSGSSKMVTWRRAKNTPVLFDMGKDKGAALPEIKQSYKSAAEFLETMYRLLRANCFLTFELRITEFVSGKLEPRDMRVYHISLNTFELLSRSSGLAIFASCVPFPGAAHIGPRSLMFGNLVCLSLGAAPFKDIIWGKVAERSVNERKSKIEAVLSFPSELNDDLEGFSLVEKLVQSVGRRLVLAESPVYFQPYSAALRVLQEMDMSQVVLATELIGKEGSDRDHEVAEVPWADAVLTYFREKMSQRWNFDASQRFALEAALSRASVAIQGPPGTGKSFIGQRFLEVIMEVSRAAGGRLPNPSQLPPGLIEASNAQDALDSSPSEFAAVGVASDPTLVVCFKNHMLDEFMRTTPTENKVRLGGRGAEDLMKYNLRELARERRKHPRIARALHELLSEKEDVEGQIKEDFCSFCMSSTPIGLLLTHASEEQLHSMVTHCPGKHPDAEKAHAYVLNLLNHGMKNDLSQKDVKACFDCWMSDARSSAIATVGLHNAPNEIGVVTSNEEADAEEDAAKNEQDDRRCHEDPVVRVTLPIPAWAEVGNFPSDNLDLEAIYEHNLWALPGTSRASLMRHWLSLEISSFRPKLGGLFTQHASLAERISQLERQHRAQILRSAEVVCCTITGACMFADLLREVNFRLVLVEEAAEIMQPLLVAALPKTALQLVQIGDHKQLRPQLEVQELAKENHLDVSMMERFVEIGSKHCVFAQLTSQSRCLPEFVELNKDIYPDLQTVEERIRGRMSLGVLQNGASSFFLDTVQFGSEDSGEGRSVVNRGEAEVICQFVAFLLREGFRAEQVTVLAYYKGQKALLRQMLKAKALDAVVETVDQYQGDENDVVLISITRSDRRTPFTCSLNRRCVACSRARIGMVFFGNYSLLESAQAWQHPLSVLKREGLVGARLPVICPRHPDETIELSSGCQHKCTSLLPCGHICEQLCHPCGDDGTQHPPCKKIVDDKFSLCGHDFTRECWKRKEDCVCKLKVPFKHERCGHQDVRLCSQSDKKCNEQVPIMCGVCQQEGRIECWKKREELDSYHCKHPCKRNMSCGHPCNQKYCGDVCDNGLDACVVCQKERERWSNERQKEIQEQVERVGSEQFFRIAGATDSEIWEAKRQLLVYFASCDVECHLLAAQSVQNAELHRRFLFASQKCSELSQDMFRLVGIDSQAEAESVAKDGFCRGRFSQHVDVYRDAPEEELQLSMSERYYMLCRVQKGREYVHDAEGIRGQFLKGPPDGFDTSYDPDRGRHRFSSKALVLPQIILRASVKPAAKDCLAQPSHWTYDNARGEGWRAIAVRDSSVLSILKKLLKTDPKELGIGRDVVQAGRYTRLDLAEAWRIENPRRWRLYAAERQGVLEELQEARFQLPKLKLRHEFFASSKSLPDDLLHDVNEVRLMHGSKPENILTLLSNGLNERFSGGMFGHGSYLAEDAGKNDQYCTVDKGKSSTSLRSLHDRLYRDGVEHPRDVFYIILCRVIMGVVARTKTGDSNARELDGNRPVWATPERRELAKASVQGSRSSKEKEFHYHSLLVELGGDVNRYREIVQFHDTRIYPEYLIAYKRR